MRIWNSSFPEKLLLVSVALNSASGLFHLFRHDFDWKVSSLNFAVAALMGGYYFFLRKYRLKYENMLTNYHRIDEERARARNMTQEEALYAYQKSLETLKRFVNAVGAKMIVCEPADLDPQGLSAEVSITINKWHYRITCASIYRTNFPDKEGTCYNPHGVMPPADRILSALLLL